MKSVIEAQGLSIRYPDSEDLVIQDLDLSISPGEFLIIAGPSGCGKSTFCRTLIGLIPNLMKGEIASGTLGVCELETIQHAVHDLTQHVGMVFQDPELNIFSLIVLDELALGPENLGLERADIIERIEVASDWVEIRDLWDRRTDKLSGGQKQRVAIAGALAMLPEVLVLDEPTTDLDPIGKRQVVETLRHLRETLGITIIVVEHDLSNLISVADRLVLLGDQGRVMLDGPPCKVLNEGYDAIQELGIRVPAFISMWQAMRRRNLEVGQMPLSKHAARELIKLEAGNAAGVCHDLSLTRPVGRDDRGSTIIEISNLYFQYSKEKPVLRDINLSVARGEFVALVGPNGAGKSTLLRLMVGLSKPNRGNISVRTQDGQVVSPKKLVEHVSFVFQDPNHQLFENTVWDEVAFSLRVQQKSQDFIERRVKEILDQVNLLHLTERHPATLSRGEKRRLAVATALSNPIDLLLLDEPTTGQDLKSLEGLFSLLTQLSREGGTAVVFVTHDMWTVWRYSTRVIGLIDGTVAFDGPTSEILHPKHEDLLKHLELELPIEAVLVCEALGN